MKRLSITALALCLFSCSEEKKEVLSETEIATPKEEKADLILHPHVQKQTFDHAVKDIVVNEDPEVDGWESETFSFAAGAQLKKLGKFLTGEAKPPENLLHPEFQSNLPTLQKLEAQILGEIQVTTSKPTTQTEASLKPLLKSSEHLKFKITRSSLTSEGASTTSVLQISSIENSTRIQLNATWECLWTKSEPPLLKSLTVLSHEEVRSPLTFTDCTASALGNPEVVKQQLVHGRDRWYGSLESSIGVEGRGNGIAIADVNNDGLEDLYLCQPAGLPNKFLLRQPDGSLRDVSSATKTDWLDSTRSALFVDLDNDGDQDLILAQSTHILIHENTGKGTFPVRFATDAKSLLFSINAIDYDGDGLLDLFASGYSGAGKIRPEDIFASPMPYHDANNGGPNLFLKNAGNWKFSDVTEQTGLGGDHLRFTLASVWEDYDNDGDPDLYLANDFGRNNLFRNDNGTFTDVAAQAGVEDIGPGMSAAWGDANNDGLMDLYVSNMFSSAGNRITRQSQFQKADLAGFQRHARGNSLFLNQGDGTFRDVSETSNTMMARWAWGSQFVDLNNDGWRDLYVTNGFVTADRLDDL
ncbi:MAG: FG-GAP repeat domain-containing protein [Akkermansiaceae bacterium]